MEFIRIEWARRSLYFAILEMRHLLLFTVSHRDEIKKARALLMLALSDYVEAMRELEQTDPLLARAYEELGKELFSSATELLGSTAADLNPIC